VDKGPRTDWGETHHEGGDALSLEDSPGPRGQRRPPGAPPPLSPPRSLPLPRPGDRQPAKPLTVNLEVNFWREKIQFTCLLIKL